MKKLTQKFLLELFKSCLVTEEIFNICFTYLEYHYLKDEINKIFWQTLKQYKTKEGFIPSIGQLSQTIESNNNIGGEKKEKLEELLNQIKKTSVENTESLILSLEQFLKDSKSVEFYDTFAEMYNQNKKDDARSYLLEFSKEISIFSLTANQVYFSDIFEEFEERRLERLFREKNERDLRRIPFSIDPLDYISHGGVVRGDTAIFLGRSGSGKTKLLKHFGVNAARQGAFVFHVQGEGTKQECLDLYDATIAGVSLWETEQGLGDIVRVKKIIKASSHITQNGGKIIVRSIEELMGSDLLSVEKMLLDLFKIYGRKPDVLILDYFELLEPGDGKKYGASEERARRKKLANILKNLAIKHNIVILTATQASNISPTDYNNSDFVMTRNDISENKSVLDPFSFFITMNQTREEYQYGIMRLYVDKIRKNRGGQIFFIKQHYETERFYDKNQSIELFEKDWEKEYYNKTA